MELHHTRQPTPLSRLRSGRNVQAALFAAYTLVVLLVGAWTYRSGLVSDALFDLRTTLRNQATKIGATFRAEPTALRIDVKLKHWKAIAGKREEALRRNLLVTDTDDFVPAEILADGQVVPVKLRLKGDLRDHWSDDDKWSLRVRTKGDHALFGMKQFSLQHPRTRGYLAEWVYHQVLRREDLIALRYRFVKVSINGADKGIYALEEHFEKRLVEHSRLREGPIVRFTEDVSWAEAARQGFLRFPEGKQRSGAGGYLAADVDGFETNRWVGDETHFAVYRHALALLDGFRRGELRAGEVFDTRKFARYLAVTELMGASHAAGWRNMRFYYNPVTTRLEPIGFDAGGHGLLPIHSLVYTIPLVFTPDRDDVYLYDYAWFDALFADRELYLAYIEELDRIGSYGYLDELMTALRPELDANLEVLHTEFPEAGFSDRVLRENVAYIRSMLEPFHAVRSHLVGQSGDVVTIAASNLQFMPLEVLGLEVDGQIVARPIQADGGPRELAGRNPKRAVALETLRFTLQGAEWTPELASALSLRYRVVGARAARSEVVLPDPPLTIGPAVGPGEATSAEFEFLVTDDATQTVSVLPGAWTIERDLVVPTGFTLVARGGTSLDLVDRAAIFCRGPVDLTGTEDEPVVIRSSDGTGQGLCVLGASGISTLRHVRFEGLDTPSRPGWQLTGAVTFYESQLTAEHCAFVGNRCEDGLNMIRTRFDISHCLFEDTFSDAFDADFCDGRMTDTSFVNCGNDGFDVSGSHVELERIFVRGAGDKGLSAGEDSEVSARDIEVHDALIGFASKDLSRLTVEGARISGCRYGVAAYRKKPEFGSSTVVVTALELSDTDEPTLIEVGSRATLDGRLVEGTWTDVELMLYGAEE